MGHEYEDHLQENIPFQCELAGGGERVDDIRAPVLQYHMLEL
jgi:hypothetical protein